MCDFINLHFSVLKTLNENLLSHPFCFLVINEKFSFESILNFHFSVVKRHKLTSVTDIVFFGVKERGPECRPLTVPTLSLDTKDGE